MAEDVVAGCGTAVMPGLPKIMGLYGKGFAKGATPALRRAAVYALGSACSTLGHAMGPHLSQILGALVPLIGAALNRDKAVAEKKDPFPTPPDPTEGVAALEEQVTRPDPYDSEEQHLALDNACSALGKVLHFTICGGGPRPLPAAVKLLGSEGAKSPAALARSFLQSLPLRHDHTECRSAVQLLAWRVELGCPLILGSGGSNVPKILATFAYASHVKSVRAAFVRAAVGRAVRALREKAPEDVLKAAMAAVPDKLKPALEATVAYSIAEAAATGRSSDSPGGFGGNGTASPGKAAAGGGGGASFSPSSAGSPW